jgi:hypothetical protein
VGADDTIDLSYRETIPAFVAPPWWHGFFNGKITGEKQEFAVVTDRARRSVLGVATRADLDEFVRRRPA